MSDDLFLIEIQNDFLTEASDLILFLEDEFLKLEQNKSAPNNLDKIMRAYHNLKGSAAAVSFEELSKFCHSIESLLVFVRLNGVAISGDLVDLLLKSNDKLRKSIEALKRDHHATIEVDTIIEEVNTLLLQLNQKPKPLLTLDTTLLDDFLTDANEQLELLDATLIQLESDLQSVEAVNLVFRAFHTLKSSSGIVGYLPIERLTHIIETLITPARDGEGDLTRSIVSAGIDAVGLIRIAIDELKNKNEPSQDVLDTFQAMIEKCQKLTGESEVGSTSPDERSLSLEYSLQHEAAQLSENQKASVVLPEKSEGVKASAEIAATTVSAVIAVGAGTNAALAVAHSAASETHSSHEQATQGQGAHHHQHREAIKVDPDRMDKLIDTIGELVIAEAMVYQSPELRQNGLGEAIFKRLNQLNKVTRQLHEVGLSLRMVPIRPTFKKMQRIVRDVSKKLGKEVLFVMQGEDTELDKTVAEKIGDPLVHMVRNAIDHGLEKNSTERINAGKPAEGKLSLKAFLKGGSVWIEIEDDGRGMNRKNIVNKAIEKGLIPNGDHLSDREIYSLIFAPGFSTAEKVTDLSGRGVGMDVVRKNIEDIHGQIEIKSEEGKGTTFSIRIPNTLAIIDGMVIYVGTERFVIPTQSIVRSLKMGDDEVFTMMGERTEVLRLNGESIPMMRLGRYFEFVETSTKVKDGLILIVEEDGKKLGLLIDRISRQQQFVTKGLDGFGRDVYGFSGGTIMPDGQVGLILDVGALIKDIENGNYLKFEKEFLEKMKMEAIGGIQNGTNGWIASA